MTSVLTSVVLLAAATSRVLCVTDTEAGRTFVLNSDRLTWEEARTRCRIVGGRLATVDHLHVIPEMNYPDNWTLWIGLHVETSGDNVSRWWLWDDGAALGWNNWYGNPERTDYYVTVTGIEDSRYQNASKERLGPDDCVVAITAAPYSWYALPCSTAMPSLCEMSSGTCKFTNTTFASLVGYNDKLVYMSRDACLSHCQKLRDPDLDCRSVEVYRKLDVCQLSSQTGWSHPRELNPEDKNWDFYQWTCINGTYLDGVPVSPNGLILPTTTTSITTVETTTTEALVSTTTIETTVPTITSSEAVETTGPDSSTLTTLVSSSAGSPPVSTDAAGEVVCVRVIIKNANETAEQMREEIQQLQVISQAVKENSKQKKKISIPDLRPSATYVGSLAVALVIGLVGFIVCLDLISIPKHIKQLHRHGSCGPCWRCSRKLHKKRLLRKAAQAMQFSHFRDYPVSHQEDEVLIVRAQRRGALRGSGALDGLPPGATPGLGLGSHRDEFEPLRQGGQKQVNRKVEEHLERIRRLSGRAEVPIAVSSPSTIKSANLNDISAVRCNPELDQIGEIAVITTRQNISQPSENERLQAQLAHTASTELDVRDGQQGLERASKRRSQSKKDKTKKEKLAVKPARSGSKRSQKKVKKKLSEHLERIRRLNRDAGAAVSSSAAKSSSLQRHGRGDPQNGENFKQHDVEKEPPVRVFEPLALAVEPSSTHVFSSRAFIMSTRGVSVNEESSKLTQQHIMSAHDEQSPPLDNDILFQNQNEVNGDGKVNKRWTDHQISVNKFINSSSNPNSQNDYNHPSEDMLIYSVQRRQIEGSDEPDNGHSLSTDCEPSDGLSPKRFNSDLWHAALVNLNGPKLLARRSPLSDPTLCCLHEDAGDRPQFTKRNANKHHHQSRKPDSLGKLGKDDKRAVGVNKPISSRVTSGVGRKSVQPRSDATTVITSLTLPEKKTKHELAWERANVSTTKEPSFPDQPLLAPVTPPLEIRIEGYPDQDTAHGDHSDQSADTDHTKLQVGVFLW